MATCMKSRTRQLPLPTPTNVRESVKLLKNVICISISQVMYARQLLPEEAFENCDVEGLQLKLIPYPGGCKSANDLNQILRAAFEALDQGYLRALQMHICPHNDPNHVVECYTFEFDYNDNSDNAVTLISSNEHERVKKTVISAGAVQKGACDLLTNTQMLMSYLASPCDKVILRFRLYYHEDTPDDYNPPGYANANPDCYLLKKNKFRNGHIQTDFHKMAMKSLIEEDNVLAEDILGEEGEAEEISQQTSVDFIPDSQPLQKKSSEPIYWAVPATPTDISCHQNGCTCGIPLDVSLMVECAKCSMWSHGRCHRILTVDKVPPVFNCLKCYSNSPSDEAYADTSLQGIEEHKQKYICIYRHALVALKGQQSVTATRIEKKMKLSRPVTEVLIRSLLADNILAKPIGPDHDASSNLFVNTKQLKDEAMLKYFELASLNVPFVQEGAEAVGNNDGVTLELNK